MKHYIVPILFVFFSSSLFSQNNAVLWDWTNVYGNDSSSLANKILVDENYNIYVAGVYNDTLIIENDTIFSWTQNGSFLAKFDVNGGLIWLRDMYYFNNGAYSSAPIQSMIFDANQNIRLMLNYHDILTCSSVDGSTIQTYALANSVSGQPYEGIVQMKMSKDNNIYVLSYINDINQSDPLGVKSRLYKFTQNYDTLWTKTISCGPSPAYSSFVGAFQLDVDTSNNVYIAGTTEYDLELYISGSEILTTTSTGSTNQNLFVAKFSDQGQPIWLENESVYYVEQSGFAVNSYDSCIYLTGMQITDEIYHDDTLIQSPNNGSQIYLLKYNLNGGFEWAKSFPLETKTTLTDPFAPWGASGTHIYTTQSGHVYLKGNFTGSIIFSGDTLVEDTTSYILGGIPNDVFISKLDSNGTAIWGKYAGDNGGSIYGVEPGGFWIDEINDVIYMVGSYADPNNSGQKSATENNPNQIFIGKEVGPTSVFLDEISNVNKNLFVYPNPSDGIFDVLIDDELIGSEYRVYNIMGLMIHSGVFQGSSSVLDLSSFNNGMFLLQTKLETIKLIKR